MNDFDLVRGIAMSIMFHCEHCGRKIEAQDSAGGKWGKCPACKNKVYVPDVNADELKLAPIDEEEEQRKKQLMAETFRITQDILSEKEVPDSAAAVSAPVPDMSDDELTKTVIDYLKQMADGELAKAEENEEIIIAFGRRALEVIDRIALSDMQRPELAHVPPQVLAGLIRNLRAKLG